MGNIDPFANYFYQKETLDILQPYKKTKELDKKCKYKRTTHSVSSNKCQMKKTTKKIKMKILDVTK